MLVLSIEIKVTHSSFSVVIAFIVVIVVVDKRLLFNLVVQIIKFVIVVLVNALNNFPLTEYLLRLSNSLMNS